MDTRRRQRMLALALCVTVAAPGCASARWSRAGIAVPSAAAQGVDAATLAEYVRTLPPGSTIKVERVDGRQMRGTLLKVTDRSLTVQSKTRIPELAIEIPLTEILRVTPAGKNGHSIAKAIGIAAAAAAGAVLAVFLIFAAIYAD